MDNRSAEKSIHQWTDEEFETLLKASAPGITPSQGFEARFWEKVAERQREPWLVGLFRGLESWVPTPSFAGALTVLVIAFLMGSAVGVYYSTRSAAVPSLEAQRTSIQYLSGFREFQGVPASSIAVTYLRTIESGGLR